MKLFTSPIRATFIVVLALSFLLAACGEEENGSNGTGDSDNSWTEPVVFADGDFDSVQFHNRVAGYIIHHGYEYDTDYLLVSTAAAMHGLTTGELDIRTEVWLEQAPTFLEGVEEGTVVDLGPNFEESVQGWFVPTYMIEGDPERGIEPVAPDLRHVDDLVRYKELFRDPEEPDKGRFYNCVPGWECQVVNDTKLEVYGLTEHFTSFVPGSDAALAGSLVAAYERGEPWLGYYWAPTWVFGQLDLTKLEEPEYTDECWDGILEGTDACAYPSIRVQIGANAEFAEAAPELAEFLRNYESTLRETSEVLLYMLDNDIMADEAAMWWLQENDDTWSTWVPDEVAERVRAALESEN